MEFSRRDFIKRMVGLGFSAATAGALFSWLSCTQPDTPPSVIPPPTTPPVSSPTPKPSVTPKPMPGETYLAVARGESAEAILQTAVKALGGIESFVKEGDDVIIKPNICVGYNTYEYAATTNPEVVAALTKLCIGAGAKKVRVMDFPFGGTAAQAYKRTGIGEAVEAAGGQMEIMSSIKFQDTPIPDGIDLKSWPVYADVLNADLVINVPIAKHHNLARLTLGMKNLLGVVQRPNQLHKNLGQRVADITSLIRPQLTIIDAVRILMNHGPTGGNLNDVKLTNTIIASRDIVAADSYAATLFGLTGSDIPIIKAAANMGLGIMDLSNVKIEEINI